MSLVNDMLRDLDNRKRSGLNRSPIRDGIGTRLELKSIKPVLFISIALMGVLVGLGAGVYYFNPGNQSVPVIAIDSQALGSRALQSTDARPVAVDANNIAGETISEPVDPTVGEAGIQITGVNMVNNDSGFTVTVSLPQFVSFEITSETAQQLNVLLPGVTISPGFPTVQTEMIEALNFYQGEAGLNLNFELDEPADFLVHDEATIAGLDIIIEAVLRAGQENNRQSPIQVQLSEDSSEAGSDSVSVSEENEIISESEPKPAEVLQIRTARELTFEETDNNTSQTAIRLAQRGQMLEAYAFLLEYIDENSQAHHSREILITLFMAQQEFELANDLVQQGLALAPNYGAYKKIQARLYMMEGRNNEALNLMRRVPPLIEDDIEYYDLMALLYQQTGDHLNAIETYQQLLRNDSQQGRWWAGMGISHEFLGNISEAVASFQAAVQIPELDLKLRQYSQNRIQNLVSRL